MSKRQEAAAKTRSDSAAEEEAAEVGEGDEKAGEVLDTRPLLIAFLFLFLLFLFFFLFLSPYFSSSLSSFWL